MAVELKPTYQGTVGPVKPKLNLFNFETKAQTPTQQVVKPTIMSKVVPQASADFLNELDYDIKNGATPEEITKAYPELKGNTKLINELHYDISNGATLDEVKQAYPEFGVQDINKLGMGQELKQRGLNLGEKLAERGGNIQESFTRERSKNPLVSSAQSLGSAIGSAGQIVGGVGDILFEGLAYVTPDIIKNGLTGGAKKAWENTPETVKQGAISAIQQGGQAYQEFKQNNPFIADTIEGTLNIASMAPIGYGAKAGQKAIKPAIEKTTAKITKGLEDVKVNRATNQVKKGEDILYEAVNPTTRENKAVLKQRVQDLLPYIEKNPIKNSLDDVKSRIDDVKIKAGESIGDYEKTVGIKGKVNTNNIIKQIDDKFIERTSKGVIINEEQAKIANQLIDKLKELGPIVKDSDIIKIRRSWDDIIRKNKGFMQSAESNIKGDIFDEANKFFRQEIRKSNPTYAKYLEDYHKSTTLSDVIEATIQRRVGQQKGGFIKRGLEAGARVTGAGLGGLPGYVASEALIQGGNLLSSSAFKLTRGAKLLKKGKKALEGKKILKPNNIKNGLDNNGSSLINNNSLGRGVDIQKVKPNVKKPSILAKEQVKQAVSKLTKDNISEVAQVIAKNYPGKLEQIKTIIKNFISKHGDKYIDKLSELVDEIATKVGSKLNLIDDTKGIGIDKTRVISKGDNLIKEARKYESADEFINALDKIRTRGQRGWGAPGKGDYSLVDVLKGKHNQPEDYFNINRYDNNEVIKTKKAIQDAKKTGEITIYRAVPKKINNFRDGEWVYLQKDMAEAHGKNALSGDYHILSKKVKNKDVHWDGNDINEWGYDTGIEIKKLKDIWKQAEKEGLQIPIKKNIDNDISALKEEARKLERESDWDGLSNIRKKIFKLENDK